MLGQHLVAFVENEDLEVVERHGFFNTQLSHSAWSSDDNVWAFLWVLEQFFVFLCWNTTVEDSGSDLWHVLGESHDLLMNLEGEFFHITEDHCLNWLEVFLV